jgi:restriction endonuclease S subunit
LALSTDTKTVRTFDDSFGTTGRLDAEYYHPKYDEITDHIKKYPLGFTRLGDIVDVIKSMEPGSDYYQETGVPFVRVSNLTTSGITNPDIHLPESYVKPFQSLKPCKDDILITKDGTIGISYKVEKDLNVFLSGAILRLVLNDKDINPDCLTLLLNSLVVAMQAERDAGGSIIQHWKVSEVKEVLIPLIDMRVQQNIAKLVQQSFEYRAKSKELLNAAKRAVEIAIEQDEQAAIDWISSNVQLPE